GQGIKVSRGFTQVNPFQMWGTHQDCRDNFRPCFLCDPQDQPAYIMLVGAGNYPTPQDFMNEARIMGVSKRIPFIPKDLELGKTIIYLAHPKSCEVKEPVALQQAMAIAEGSETNQPRLLETEKVEKALGIFTAFIPQRVEKLVWESELEGEQGELYKASLEKRGITPIVIPSGDKDHK
ncbi:unnamed protein product, partial [marine sediment metagenome]